MADETQPAVATVGAESSTIPCAACGRENPAGMRFCGNCGQPLVGTPVLAITPPPAPPRSGEGSLVNAGGVSVPAVAVSGGSVEVSELPSPVAGEGPGVGADKAAGKGVLDPIARERERDRLLTLANVQRMRGQTSDARQTLQDALALVEGTDAAPIYELIGDMLTSEEKWTEALDTYDQAHKADPKRASAERKFATMTLRVADTQSQRSLADAVLRGDSISDLVATGALESGRGKRNAGMAMFLSVIVPGFGQFYNGEVVKGMVLVGLFLADLLLLAFTPDRKVFMGKMIAIFALSPGRYGNRPFSALATFAGIVLAAVWLYSIVDAPFMAAKTAKLEGEGGSKPPIDKTGWEV